MFVCALDLFRGGFVGFMGGFVGAVEGRVARGVRSRSLLLSASFYKTTLGSAYHVELLVND